MYIETSKKMNGFKIIKLKFHNEFIKNLKLWACYLICQLTFKTVYNRLVSILNGCKRLLLTF